jgi:hypothetical protein
MIISHKNPPFEFFNKKISINISNQPSKCADFFIAAAHQPKPLAAFSAARGYADYK